MPKTTDAGYGWRHQQLRKKWAIRIARGGVMCAREDCPRPGRLILPGEAWDLGHDDDDRNRYTGPEHRACNRRSVSHLKAALAEARRAPAAANGVGREAWDKKARQPRFGGLPDPTPENSVSDWSRHWYGGFNPRCGDCRRLGRACDAADVDGAA